MARRARTTVGSTPGEADLASKGEEMDTSCIDQELEQLYLVEACRAPEADVQEAWGDNMDLKGAVDVTQYWGEFHDDKTGKVLDPRKVRAAREEDIKELERRVFEYVDVEECWRVKGKPPVPVRWVDVDKGFGVVRGRLVAKDFKPKSSVGDRDDLFAAMPPLEAVKLLVAQGAAEASGSAPRKLMFIDISKAHLYGKMETDEYVQLPAERAVPGKCAKLVYTLYGMRMAASNWEREYTKTLVELGFEVGRASSVVFYHPGRKIRIVVHGDDFIIEGEERDLWYVHDALKAKYLLKMRGILGPGENDQKEVVVLNRILRWQDGVFQYEADPRHVEQILRDMEMQDCRPCVSPSTRPRAGDAVDEIPLDCEQHRLYRSVVARANFLAQDRPDIRYCVKELCRRMSGPRACDMCALKRLCRYLKGRPRAVQSIVLGCGAAANLDVYTQRSMPDDWVEPTGATK